MTIQQLDSSDEHIHAVRSFDGGTTWTGSVDITPGTGFDASFASLADWADDTLHIVYNSDRLAGNWIQFNHPQIEVTVKFLKVPASAITDVHEISGSATIVHRLEQNYPNPFNPRTKIVYRVGSRESVELRIFDVLGREVETLVNEEKEAGTYQVTWEASNVASGVYFYRLNVGDFVQTKKMLLIR